MITKVGRDPSSTSVLGLIPARAGSKGVPGKNIVHLGGIPLITHTIRAAKESKYLGRIVVSTDGEDIAEVCRSEGLSLPWLRPKELAGDASRVQDAVLHAIERTPGAKDDDYLLLLQPTAPFRSTEDIDAAICLAKLHQATSVVSFTIEESHHPYYMFRYESEHGGSPSTVRPFFEYEPGLPRQQFPRCVCRNGAIYLVRLEYFLSKNAFMSPDCIPYLMPYERSVNIDSKADLKYAEFLLRTVLEG